MAVAQYMLFNAFVLVLATVLGSWLGHRFGARAMLMIPLPFAYVVLNVAQYRSGGADSVSLSAEGTLSSLAVLYGWGLSYFFVSQWTDERLRVSPGMRALVTSLVSIALSLLIRAFFFEPILEKIEGDPLAISAFSVGSIALAAATMRWWLADSPPQRGDAPRTNYLLRPLSILLLLMLANYVQIRSADEPAFGPVHFVMTSFPRLTFELVIASHIAQGAKAAQECFYGLSYGLIPPVLWLLGMVWLPTLGPEVAFWIAGVGLVSSWAATVYLVSRLPRAI